MPEVVGTFLSAEVGQEPTDRSVQTRHSPFGNLAQQGLEFAVGQLDRIEVGRILWQIAKNRSRSSDDLFQSRGEVGGRVIHHDDIAGPERRKQALLGIGQKGLLIHRAFDHHRRGHSVMTQRSHEGECLPVSERYMADQPDTAGSAPPEAHHIGADCGLVDKHQPGGVKQALLSDPASSRSGYVGSLTLGGLQAFF